MGFLRKATFVATGGASGLVFKANSKKERIANALEKQNRMAASAAPAVRVRPPSPQPTTRMPPQRAPLPSTAREWEAVAYGGPGLYSGPAPNVSSTVQRVQAGIVRLQDVDYLGGFASFAGSDFPGSGLLLHISSHGGICITRPTAKEAAGHLNPWPYVRSFTFEEHESGKVEIDVHLVSGETARFLSPGDVQSLEASFAPVIANIAAQGHPEDGRDATVPKAETEAVRAQPTPTTEVVAAFVDLAEALSRLAALRDRGVLTTEEFETQKARLLNS